MKLLQIIKGMRTVALIIVVAFVALLAVAPTVDASAKPAADDHAGGTQLEDGAPGDHHAKATQDSVLHWSGSIMFWEYVTFGLVLLILGVGVFPKLIGQLNERSKNIADAQAKAELVLAEAHALEATNQEKLNNAHIEAKKITDEAVVAAKEVEAKIKAEAEADAKNIRAKAEQELEQLTKMAKAELREQAVELALMAAGKVIQKSMGDDDHRRLAKEAVEAAGTLKN